METAAAVTSQRSCHSHARTASATSRRHASRLSRSETTPLPPTDMAFDSPPSSFGARSTRSLSSASRNSNRLSLTLPIALPTNAPSRPTPISTTLPSFPPTPRDTPTARSPIDANDFIHAIAAQERRVLELRDDLKNAEAELSRLKKQWGAFDSVRKRSAIVNSESSSHHHRHSSSTTAAAVDDVESKTRSIELDRRRTMLMSQQNKDAPATSASSGGRRRVMRGGHTRALSLLSPTKPEGGFPILHDALDCHQPLVRDSEPHLQIQSNSSSSNMTSRQPPLAANGISKRATWAPRTHNTTFLPPPSSNNNNNAGVKQMAEDFKAGLWTFVEDLRQVAVGDEPITGAPSGYRRVSGRQNDSDRDTIRACAGGSAASRPNVTSVFGGSSTDNNNTTASSTRQSTEPRRESDTANLGRPRRTNSKRTKHFSWTPLSVDAFDDADWSNWESPSLHPTTPSPRWSGTTINGDVISTAIPESSNGDENDSLKNQTLSSSSTIATNCSASSILSSPPPSSYDYCGYNGGVVVVDEGLSSPESPPLSAVKIEEMLNKLSPGNLKRATSEFMKEWERSLGEPVGGVKDKAC